MGGEQTCVLLEVEFWALLTERMPYMTSLHRYGTCVLRTACWWYLTLHRGFGSFTVTISCCRHEQTFLIGDNGKLCGTTTWVCRGIRMQQNTPRLPYLNGPFRRTTEHSLLYLPGACAYLRDVARQFMMPSPFSSGCRLIDLPSLRLERAFVGTGYGQRAV